MGIKYDKILEQLEKRALSKFKRKVPYLELFSLEALRLQYLRNQDIKHIVEKTIKVIALLIPFLTTLSYLLEYLYFLLN